MKIHWPGTKAFVKRLAKEWSEDTVSDTAAALTYYDMLALFPFLLFVVALVALILDPHNMQQIVNELATVAPQQVTQILSGELNSMVNGSNTSLLTFGILGTIYSAANGINALMLALDRCYDLRETRPWWKTWGLSVLMTFVAGVISVIAVAITFVVPVVAHFFGGWVGALINWARFPVAGAFLLLLWALFYWALPNVKPTRFQLVTPGSLFGVVVWLLASWGFSEYVRHFGTYQKTYGALGGIIVLLVWMWISGVVLLIGAEINKILTPAEKLKRSPTGEATGENKEDAMARPKGPPEPQPA